MRTVNKVILIGNITRDPAIKTTENDKKVALLQQLQIDIIKHLKVNKNLNLNLLTVLLGETQLKDVNNF